MQLRPRKRIWPSPSRVARSNSERQVLGLRNGSSPSKTSISASAPNTRSLIALLSGAGVLLARCRCGAGGRSAHRAEEVAARIHHHQVALRTEARPISLEAAVELGELRVAAEGVGIQRTGL